VNTTLKKAILAIAVPVMERAASAYVAGPELEDALRVSRKLAERDCRSIFCFWDGPNDEPGQITAAYAAAVQSASGESSDTYVALKAPSLRYSRELIAGLIPVAQNKKIRLHFDALDMDTVDPTISLISDLLPSYSHFGCTLPGRWKRSITDADWAVSQGLCVRVVKGQWPDPSDPKADLRAGFLSVIAQLAGRAKLVGVASHDPAVVRPALQILKDAGTPCELELLYGLPVGPAMAIARSLHVPVRFYIPYGHAWLPYSLSQAKRNPRILWWTMRDMLFRSRRNTVYS
jgi:proline dehydrogenase